MQWVASTLHTTSEHGVSSITTADTHTSAASSRLNWRPHRIKWTRPFRRKTKSGFCACAITFQTQSIHRAPCSLSPFFNRLLCTAQCLSAHVSLICDSSVTTQNLWFFQENLLKVLECYNFLRMQRRHNCSPAASFANCVMTLYLLKVHQRTFLSIPVTQKCQILSCDTLVANERY